MEDSCCRHCGDADLAGPYKGQGICKECGDELFRGKIAPLDTPCPHDPRPWVAAHLSSYQYNGPSDSPW